MPHLLLFGWRWKGSLKILKKTIMSDNDALTSNERHIGQTVRQACIQAAKEGFQDASMRGLCTEGAIEAAIGAIQLLDVEQIVAKAKQADQ